LVSKIAFISHCKIHTLIATKKLKEHTHTQKKKKRNKNTVAYVRVRLPSGSNCKLHPYLTLVITGTVCF